MNIEQKAIDAHNHNDQIRLVALTPYRIGDPNYPFFLLSLRNSHRVVPGTHSAVGYKLTYGDGTPIFEGDDVNVASTTAIDSNEAIRVVMMWLSFSPHDTDKSYFDDYTPEQLDFAVKHGDNLAVYGDDRFPETPRDVTWNETEAHWDIE